MGEPAENLILETSPVPRPKTRGDCVHGPRPCPWVSCKYHLLVDVVPGVLNRGRREPPLIVHGGRGGRGGRQLDEARVAVDLDQIVNVLFDLSYTCVLDAVTHTDRTLEETGRVLCLTREAARQIEQRAWRKLGLKGVPTWWFKT